MDVKKMTLSSIVYDAGSGLHWLNIGLRSAGFESIYYRMNGVERTFGDLIDDFYGQSDGMGSRKFAWYDSSHAVRPKSISHINTLFQPDECIIGVSRALEFSTVYLYSANNKVGKTFFVSTGFFYTFRVKTQPFILFIYRDVLGNTGYYTDLDDPAFTFVWSNSELSFVSSLFGSVIYVWDIPLRAEIIALDSIVESGLNIADFFLFRDPFLGDIHTDYLKFLRSIQDTKIFVGKNSYVTLAIQEYDQDFYPVCTIGCKLFKSSGEELDFRDVQKCIFSYLPYYCLASVIDDPEITRAFAQITKVSSIDLACLDGLSTILDSFDSYSDEGMKSWRSFLQIQYNYYVLKTSLGKIDELLSTLSVTDPQYGLLMERNLINKANIEAILPKYEMLLRDFQTLCKKDM